MAEQKTFNFELVSPEAKIMSEPAWQVAVPGEDGEFDVLAGHSSLVAMIKPGVVRVWTENNDKPQNIFIAGGFADVTAENLTILAEEAVNVEELDISTLEQDVANLNSQLEAASEKGAQSRIKQSLNVAKAKIVAAKA